MPELTNIKIELNKENILKRLGHSPKIKIDERLNGLIDSELDNAYCLIDPYCIYKDLEIESVKEDKIKLKDAFIINSRPLANILKDAKKATLIALTIGNGLEKRTENLLIDSIRDAIGSEAAEELARTINRQITKRAESLGYKTLQRFSAGYGNWDVKDQEKIFKLLNPKEIKLGGNYIMHPMKSITAIIGWKKQ